MPHPISGYPISAKCIYCISSNCRCFVSNKRKGCFSSKKLADEHTTLTKTTCENHFNDWKTSEEDRLK